MRTHAACAGFAAERQPNGRVAVSLTRCTLMRSFRSPWYSLLRAMSVMCHSVHWALRIMLWGGGEGQGGGANVTKQGTQRGANSGGFLLLTSLNWLRVITCQVQHTVSA